MLACLPDHGRRSSLAKAVIACRTLVTGDVCQAQDRALERELFNCVNLLSNVNDGHGATAVEMSKMADFPKQFLENTENVCAFTASENEAAPGKREAFWGCRSLEVEMVEV